MTKEESSTLSLGSYAPDARAWVVGAQALADDRRHAEVSPLHLLSHALERDPGALEVFRRSGVNVVELTTAAERALAALPKGNEPAYLSPRLLDLLRRAERESERERSPEVRVEHLLNALSQEVRGPAGELLGGFGVAPGALRAHLGALRDRDRRPAGANESAG